MDPRIRQLDIIMREEASAERLRTNDQRYINNHLNTPGYRHYRPAWNMTAWHVAAPSDKQNSRKQSVLDGLTDAQKAANTTRGSTPGLIDPASGEALGNRIPLPNVARNKQGPRPAGGNANNTPAVRPIQPAHALPVPQVSRAPQMQQPLRGHQNQQFLQYPGVATAPLFVASVAMAAPLQKFASIPTAPVYHPSTRNVKMTADLAIQEQNDLRGYANAQACDTAEIPLPLLPSMRRNGPFPHPRALTPTQLNGVRLEDFPARRHQVPEPEFSLMSDEEISRMSARSDAALAEIDRMCEPFIDPGINFQTPPPIELSAEFIEDFGMGYMFPSQSARAVRGSRNTEKMPNSAQTIHVAPRRTPIPPERQGAKRKERDDGHGNFQGVILDIETQEPRPIKRAKSVHNANFGSSNPVFDQYNASRAEQQNHSPRLGYIQSTYGQGQVFHGSTPQGVRQNQHALVEKTGRYVDSALPESQNHIMIEQRPNRLFEPHHPQIYPSISMRTDLPDHQPHRPRSVASPHAPAFTARDQSLHNQHPLPQPTGSPEEFMHGGIDLNQAVGHASSAFSSAPTAQRGSHKSPTAQDGSRAGRGHHGGSLAHASNDHRFHPYAR